MPSRENLQQQINFPPHVWDQQVGRNPFVERVARMFLEPDSEQAVRLESKITPEELKDIGEIHRYKDAYDALLKDSKKEEGVFLTQEYARLKNQPDKTFDTFKQTLALSLLGMERCHEGLSVWDTQIVGLLRACRALLRDDTSGLIEHLRGGMGKTDVLIPAIVPIALLKYGHVDVVSLTPLTSTRSARRFQPLADLLGITHAQMTEETTMIHRGGYAIKTLWQKDSDDPRSLALTAQVTFGEQYYFAFHLMRHQFDPLVPNTLSGRYGRLAIVDEVDQINIEQAHDLLVLAKGEGEPADMYVSSLFRNVPDDHEQKRSLENMFWSHNEQARALFAPGQNPDSHALFSVCLLREIMSYYKKFIALDPDQPQQYKLFDKNGALTKTAEYNIYQRLYCKATDTSYHGDIHVPDDWLVFLSDLIPADVFESISAAIVIQRRHLVYFHKDKLVSVSPFTGWPQEKKEFRDLVLVCLTLFESLNRPVILPETLRSYSDTMSTTEIFPLFYEKLLGFSATAIESTAVFRKTHDLDVTALPEQHPWPDAPEHFIPTTPEHRLQDASDYILRLAETTGPILVDVPSQETANQLCAMLMEKITGVKTVRVLSAANADEAGAVFTMAGTEDTITLVVQMAQREVDIPVSSSEGLRIVAWEPRLYNRNQRQLWYRSGRAQPGGSVATVGKRVCFVAPDDEVFSLLPSSGKKKIWETFSRGDSSELASLVLSAQRAHEERLDEQNASAAVIYAPLLYLRRQLLSQPEWVRAKLKPVWPDVVEYVRAQGRGLFSINPVFRSRPPFVQTRLWRLHVAKLFEKVLGIVDIPYNKYSTSSFEESVRDILQRAAEEL